MRIKPKISVIIPVYNAEKTIRRCLDSLVTQTYQNLEIILIDDGSEDDSFGVCRQYEEQDARIILIHKQNEGVSATRNVGLKIATGDYIGFLDSDDWIESCFFETLLLLADRYDADIVACNFKMVNSEMIELSRKNDTISELQIFDSTLGIEDAVSRLDVAIWNKLFRRDIIFTTDGEIRHMFSEKYYIGEDMLWFIAVLKNAKKYIYAPIKMYYYYVNTQGAMQSLYKLSDRSLTAIDTKREVAEEVKGVSEKAYSFALKNYIAQIRDIVWKAYINKKSEIVDRYLELLIRELKRYMRLKFPNIKFIMKSIMMICKIRLVPCSARRKG